MLLLNPYLRQITSRHVTVRGLRTTESKKTHKPAAMHGVQFVSYGEHVVRCEEQYKQEVLSLLQAYAGLVCDKCGLTEYQQAIGAALPHLDVKTLSSGHNCGTDEPSVASEWPLKNTINEAFSAHARLHDDFKAVRLDLPTNITDPLLSPAAVGDGLTLIGQICRENLATSYSVLEIGPASAATATDGGGSDVFSKLAYPTFAADISAYEACNVPHWSEEIVFFADDLHAPTAVLKSKRADLVIASQVVSGAAVIQTCLHALADMLQPGGSLLLHEYIGVFPLLYWGQSERFSGVEDRSDRDFGRWLSKDRWIGALRAAGLEPVIWFVDESHTQLLLLATPAHKSLSCEGSGDERFVLSSAADLTAPVQPDTTTLIETSDFGNLGLVRCLRKEPSFAGVTLSLNLTASVPPPPRPLLPISIYRDGVLGGMHELPLKLLTRAVAGSHAEVLSPGDLSSLCWVESETIPNCDVSYCGINFKDVMLASGKLTSPGSVKIGFEFSGVKTSSSSSSSGSGSGSSSQPVMGIGSGCLTRKLFVHDHLCWPVPAGMTLEAACTVPVVYATVYYSLIVKANIQSGQTVLIHSIAGGVGQAAFHVCKFRNINVIVTCSAEKVDWVHRVLKVPHSHILDSRSVSFRDGVLQLTKGRGVDAVLNSLSGDKLTAGLASVAPYGHFIEIGKFDIQQNSPIGLGAFERHISIHGFDLSDLFDKPRQWGVIHKLVAEGLLSGEVVPLQSTVFEEVEPALRFISTGKHIGKVLVSVGNGNCGIEKERRTFSTRGLHVVVGGLGGFGLELVQFLWAHGAERIIIVSRGEPSVFHQMHIQTATVSHVDLGDANACDEFFSALGDELVGVWHLAMVLNDGLYSKMTVDKWSETIRVKATICANADVSTRKFNRQLQQFVVWSSVTALFGNPGQSNYGYANSAMERTCMRRKEESLPGLAIQWGFIGGVGVMLHTVVNASLAFVPQHIDSCLDSLNSLLLSDHAIVSCYLRKSGDKLITGAALSLHRTLSQRIAHVLGFEPKKINSSATLASLGMDSLQSVEVSNILKNVKSVNIQGDSLKNMTWCDILGMD